MNNKNSKGFAPIIMIIVIVLLGIGGYMLFALEHKNNAQLKTAPSTSLTDNWEIFESKEFGISFKFPDDIFQVQQIPDTDGKISHLSIVLKKYDKNEYIAQNIGIMDISLNSSEAQEWLQLLRTARISESAVVGKSHGGRDIITTRLKDKAIGGLSAQVYGTNHGISSTLPHSNTIVTINGNILDIRIPEQEYGGLNRTIADQILSTFKFLD